MSDHQDGKSFLDELVEDYREWRGKRKTKKPSEPKKGRKRTRVRVRRVEDEPSTSDPLSVSGVILGTLSFLMSAVFFVFDLIFTVIGGLLSIFFSGIIWWVLIAFVLMAILNINDGTKSKDAEQQIEEVADKIRMKLDEFVEGIAESRGITIKIEKDGKKEEAPTQPD